MRKQVITTFMYLTAALTQPTISADTIYAFSVQKMSQGLITTLPEMKLYASQQTIIR